MNPSIVFWLIGAVMVLDQAILGYPFRISEIFGLHHEMVTAVSWTLAVCIYMYQRRF